MVEKSVSIAQSGKEGLLFVASGARDMEDYSSCKLFEPDQSIHIASKAPHFDVFFHAYFRLRYVKQG